MNDVTRIFSNETDVGQLARMVMWNGLDMKVRDAWDWYRSARERNERTDVLLEDRTRGEASHGR